MQLHLLQMRSILAMFAPMALIVLVSGDITTTDCVGGPCGPAHQQCGPIFGQDTPQFHVRDASCAENDPNGPFYWNGAYHHFYQDHISIAPGRGPDWGHAISSDLVTWAHLPVAIWNDQPYDSVAIYTGSATLVDDKPVIVYPGLCTKDQWAGCVTGTLLAIALPEDLSDPLLTNWTKPSYNPIVNNTQRDPTSSWQEPSGEWRMTSYDGSVYASMDFQKWYRINGSSGFTTGECPSFFPLPGSSPRLGATHVFKSSFGGKDNMQVGRYIPGTPGQPGNWTPLTDFRIIDVGDFYASKDLFDSSTQRRINWGWAKVPPASTQTLPRVMGWDEDLELLTFSPAAELSKLRQQQLVDAGSLHVAAGQHAWLGSWADGTGNQSELIVTFTLPNTAAMFGVDVVAGVSPPTGKNASTRVFILYDPAASNASVGVSGFNPPGPAELTQYMVHTDLTGGDFNVTNVEYTDPHICEAVCIANPDCQAWTYVTRPPLVASCCQKGATGFRYNPDSPTCTSGVRTPRPAPIDGTSDSLVFKPGETTVTIHVFIDNTFIEAYWQDGRVAMTKTFVDAAPEFGMAIFAESADVAVVSAQAWHMGGIWKPAEVVKAEIMEKLEG